MANKLDIPGDHLAQQTDWEPIARGGANYRTKNLKEINVDHWQYKASGKKIFLIVNFAIIGLGISLAPYIIEANGGKFRFSKIPLFLIGSFFCFIAFIMFKLSQRTGGFDLKKRCFYKMTHRGKEVYSFDDIHALQIIDEYIHSHSSSPGQGSPNYHSYELNIVRKCASRINLIDHGDLKQIRQDAQKIAKLLEVPIWDKAQ